MQSAVYSTGRIFGCWGQRKGWSPKLQCCGSRKVLIHLRGEPAELDLGGQFDREFDKLFAAADENHDGKLTRSEINKFLSKMSQREVSDGIIDCSQLQFDADGRCDKMQLLEVYRSSMMQRRDALFRLIEDSEDFHTRVDRVWKHTDADGSGAVDVREVYALMQEYARNMTYCSFDEQLVQKYFKIYDTDHNGTLDRAEFSKFIEHVFFELLIMPGTQVVHDRFVILGASGASKAIDGEYLHQGTYNSFPAWRKVDDSDTWLVRFDSGWFVTSTARKQEDKCGGWLQSFDDVESPAAVSAWQVWNGEGWVCQHVEISSKAENTDKY